MKFIANTSDLSKYLEVAITKNETIKNISTDTRTIQKGSMFIAIKGKNFDGNDFIDDALDKGAIIVLADNKHLKNNKNEKIIYVRDSILALKKISKNILKKYNGNVVAITGSNGKTTTTNLIAKTLRNNSKTLKNFNNEIGVPLSIMNASPKSKHLVLEIGASKFKDIDYLSKILQPHIGVITNIGNSHLEKLRNISGVFKVKSEIIKNMRKDGILIVPNDNKNHLDKWKKMRSDLEVISFKLYPRLRKLRQFFLNIDKNSYVRMTGSGSTIVGYFMSKKAALNAKKLLKKKYKNYWCSLSKTI